MSMIDTTRPASRMLAVLELLQDHPGITGPQLADRLDVSGRTVRRYIATLQDMGIPVEPVAGRRGGYALRPGFRLPPLMFSAEEALGLAMALLATKVTKGATLPGSVESALAKIERVIPTDILERIEAVREGTVLPQGSEWDSTFFPDPEVLSTMAQAVLGGRRVWFRYGRPNGEETARAVDPYGMTALFGRWYLVGWCHLRNERRTFRIDRIRRVDLEEESFEPPQAFDVVAEVERSLAMSWDGFDVEVIVEQSAECVSRDIPGRFAVIEAIDEHRTRLRARSSDIEYFGRRLIMFSQEFTVVSPPELRDFLGREAERLAAIASRTTPPEPVARIS